MDDSREKRYRRQRLQEYTKKQTPLQKTILHGIESLALMMMMKYAFSFPRSSAIISTTQSIKSYNCMTLNESMIKM
jgi:hypothetical protein